MKFAKAAYDTVHECSEGVDALAQKIGMKSKQVLINKVCMTTHTHHLTLAEAARIMKVTGDVRIIHALADDMGGIYVPGVQSGDAGALSVINDISKMSQEFGLLIQEVADDIQDGIITDNEFGRIQAEANKLRLALLRLLSDLSDMHEKTKTKHIVQ